MNNHPALQSAKTVLIPGAYNNLGLHCRGGDLNALNGGREMVRNTGRGGSVVSDVKDWYNQNIPEQYHSGIESLARAGAKDLGFGLYSGMGGNYGGSLRSDAEDFYNQKIPEQYHSGIESLGRAAAKDLGFGLYAGANRGRGVFGDSDAIFGKILDGLTEGGKKILEFAPQVLSSLGMPSGPVSYLIDKYVADPNDEAGKSRRRAEAASNPAPAPAPFKADLPAVPRRPFKADLPAVPKRDNYIKDKSSFNKMPDSYTRYRDNNGQGLGDMNQMKDEVMGHMRNAYDQIPHQLHPAIEAFGKAGMNSLGFGLGDYVHHFKNMVGKIAQHIPKEHHHHLEHIGRAAMDHSLHHLGMGLDLGIKPYVDSNGERPMSLDWIGKHTGISGINDHMFGGNIMEDFGDASAKFIQGAMRDTPDWLKGPEKDPLAFMYGGEVGDGVGCGVRPKLVKGSPEAKAFMAAMRAKRGKKKMKGGSMSAEPPRSRSYTTDPSLL